MFTRAIKDPVSLDRCDFSVHSNGSELANILAYYERLRSYVQHEDGLINSRLTWSLTIHGFLFAIFGILASKAVDILMAARPMAVAVTGLLVVEIIVALVGILVGYYSREAIVAAHNALKHLYAIAHWHGPLQFAASTTSATEIPAGLQAVTPATMAQIAIGAQLLVGTEVVTVAATNSTNFTATFEREQKPAPVRIVPLAPVLLPKIVSGGANEVQTAGAIRYYIHLPEVMIAAWSLLGLFSAYVLYVLHYCPQALR